MDRGYDLDRFLKIILKFKKFFSSVAAGSHFNRVLKIYKNVVKHFCLISTRKGYKKIQSDKFNYINSDRRPLENL